MNVWEDANVIERVNKIGLRRLVVGELSTSVRIVGPAVSALGQEFEVYVHARRRRQRIERVFGHPSRNLELRTLKLRGLAGAAEEFTMAAAAYNLQLVARQAASA